MSRIAVGVTCKLKATCQKKPAYNKFGDRDVLGCPDQFEGDEFDEEDFNYLYETKPFSDYVDDEERKERVVDIMYYERIAEFISDDYPMVRPGGKFKYVSLEVYLHISRPPIGRGDISYDQQPPYIVRVRNGYAISDDGCTMFPVPLHHQESFINQWVLPDV